MYHLLLSPAPQSFEGAPDAEVSSRRSALAYKARLPCVGGGCVSACLLMPAEHWNGKLQGFVEVHKGLDLAFIVKRLLPGVAYQARVLVRAP
jgi:hypothetical protein